MSAILKAENISKIYESKEHGQTLQVLSDINLEIIKGESIAIVGASGSGKSTLLHILGGLDTPSTGSIFFNGTKISSLNKDELATFRNRNLGFVFQFHHLLPEFSAIENVFMPGLIAKTPFNVLREKAADLLTQFGLEGRMNHRPSELSGGEQQRVAVARALINDPEIILADEPTGNLDENSTQNLLSILFPLVKSRNLTLVLVTHDMQIANTCTKTYKLERGSLVD
jgi:lipoprotein-releasing system ATP-binding protein